MKNLLLALFLASCAHNNVEQNIYQPKVLILGPNTKVQTIEGVYTTGKTDDEIWYSQESISKLEKQLSQF